MVLDSDLIKLKEYYQRIEKHLDNKDLRSAEDILYFEMSQELLDIALDMIYNRNKKFTEDDLRQYIISVEDKLLALYRNNGIISEEVNNVDNFNGVF